MAQRNRLNILIPTIAEAVMVPQHRQTPKGPGVATLVTRYEMHMRRHLGPLEKAKVSSSVIENITRSDSKSKRTKAVDWKVV